MYRVPLKRQQVSQMFMFVRTGSDLIDQIIKNNSFYHLEMSLCGYKSTKTILWDTYST